MKQNQQEESVAVLAELIKEIQTLEADRDKAEANYIREFNKAGEVKNVARRIQTRIRILEEQTEKAKQGPIRGGFWIALDEVINLNKEIAEVLAEEPPIKESEDE